MVYGNMSDKCATGVAFTRDPSTGVNKLYGEFLLNAQGEDVVAGIRTLEPIARMKRVLPQSYAEFEKVCRQLEKHYRDMQDMEFTIQQGRLWVLQTRTGKRTAAAVKIAVDMVNECLISRDEALQRLEDRPRQAPAPHFDAAKKTRVIGKGLLASPGAASGKAVFLADEAEAQAGRGEPVILVRIETSPEDIFGMHAAQGVLTARDGMTSHAAVVARGMGKCCVAGCGDIAIDYGKDRFGAAGKMVKKGDWISLDGTSGEVMLGRVPTREAKFSREFATLMQWADRRRKLAVRTNADTPNDAAVARRFGAEGIGLCRTEHMFFEEDRIAAVRQMLLADDEKDARRCWPKLNPCSGAILRASSKPCTACRSRCACSTRRCTSLCRWSWRSSARWRANSGCRWPKSKPRSRRCASSTPCSATAAAAWASPTPRSTGCRWRPFLRRRSRWGSRG